MCQQFTVFVISNSIALTSLFILLKKYCIDWKNQFRCDSQTFSSSMRSISNFNPTETQTKLNKTKKKKVSSVPTRKGFKYLIAGIFTPQKFFGSRLPKLHYVVEYSFPAFIKSQKGRRHYGNETKTVFHREAAEMKS